MKMAIINQASNPGILLDRQQKFTSISDSELGECVEF